MSKHKQGEHILLYFEDNDVKEYIKGWGLSDDECKAALQLSFGNDVEFKRTIKETYAQWYPSRDECGDFVSELHEKESPGNGKFKITIVEVERY